MLVILIASKNILIIKISPLITDTLTKNIGQKNRCAVLISSFIKFTDFSSFIHAGKFHYNILEIKPKIYLNTDYNLRSEHDQNAVFQPK